MTTLQRLSKMRIATVISREHHAYVYGFAVFVSY